MTTRPRARLLLGATLAAIGALGFGALGATAAQADPVQYGPVTFYGATVTPSANALAVDFTVAHADRITPAGITYTVSFNGAPLEVFPGQDTSEPVEYSGSYAIPGPATGTVSITTDGTDSGQPFHYELYSESITIPATDPSESPQPDPDPSTSTPPTSSPAPSTSAAPAPSTAPAGPTARSSKTSEAAGGQVTVSAAGFRPNEPIEIVLHSTPVRLYMGAADAGGRLVQVVTIPANTPAGAHTIEVRGTQSGTVTIPITISAGLAYTGVDAASSAVGAAALLIAGSLLVSTRLRRGRRLRS